MLEQRKEAPMQDEQLLTVKEVAERLRANPQTVRRWLREGKLGGVMPGGEKLGYRIPESEVRRLLQGKAAA
jgi:excisionase family DNA binding protein